MKRRAIDEYGNAIEDSARPRRSRRLNKDFLPYETVSVARWTRLPADIVGLIIRFAIDDVYRLERSSAEAVFRAMMPFAHVCSRWREIVKALYQAPNQDKDSWHIISWIGLFRHLFMMHDGIKDWVYKELKHHSAVHSRKRGFTGIGVGFDLMLAHDAAENIAVALRNIHGSVKWRQVRHVDVMNLYAEMPKFTCGDVIPHVKRIPLVQEAERACCTIVRSHA
jgi:hypothetical protein